LRSLILQLKFERRERLARPLGALLKPLWESLDLQDALLVPVPLHSSRQRQRGFNQAELLAQGLARSLRQAGWKPRVQTRCLRRTRPTPPQTGLSPTARRENVRGVFVVDRPEIVRDRGAALIDDVMTTGATLSACAAALKQAGARRVWALSLARATPQFPDFEPGMPLMPVDEFSRKQT
jgi:ComF family protein